MMWPHEKPEAHFPSHRILLDNSLFVELGFKLMSKNKDHLGLFGLGVQLVLVHVSKGRFTLESKSKEI